MTGLGWREPGQSLHWALPMDDILETARRLQAAPLDADAALAANLIEGRAQLDLLGRLARRAEVSGAWLRRAGLALVVIAMATGVLTLALLALLPSADRPIWAALTLTAALGSMGALVMLKAQRLAAEADMYHLEASRLAGVLELVREEGGAGLHGTPETR